ncbi:MAG: phospho-N-acetylmuramoyl-pentapeptide-transferase [Synergistaceae bacterium]|jgi:phospho-N-acetylmuramoyl-pentapeptide-transferase|nr:phospho-N-acetylmuramoyl-pentapeptide-transferase [Synergistaceae bacterium]
MLVKAMCLSLIFFAASVYFQGIWIRAMRYLRAGEAIKDYGPPGHKKKRGTPSMGGIVAFIMSPAIAAAICYCGMSGRSEMIYIWSYPLLTGGVGLADDLLKNAGRSSEGLRSLQKLFLQTAVSVPWAWHMAGKGIALVPGSALPFGLGLPLLVLVGVGMQNAVNVTDGLDGLAGGAVAISLSMMFAWAHDQAVLASASAALAVVLAFLWHNSNPAQLFMGDVGSHFWGGLLTSLCAASGALIFIIPTAFLFGVELLTSAIQIASIRGFKKKVFKMSPLHHHFELSGMGEPSIVARFLLVHVVGIAVCVIFIEAVLKGVAWNVRT